VKRGKRNREIIPATRNHNGTIITDNTEKSDIFNSYYACVFCCDSKIPQIKLANPAETFITDTKIIRKRLTKIGKNKSFSTEILKFGGVPSLFNYLDYFKYH